MSIVGLLSDIGHTKPSFLYSTVTKTHKVLEIGGSYNPIFRRNDGYDLWTADHDTQDNLIAKYEKIETGHGKHQIEYVDFVSTDGNLNVAVPLEHSGTFDFVISSHNIEHIPNPIAHLKSIERLLSSTGSFLMIAPDKRGCFDLLRPFTTTGQWIEAYLKPQPYHSIRTRFDCESYSVGNSGAITWGNDEIFDDLVIASGIPLPAVFENVREPAVEYWDGHAWNFTPHSMFLILREIHSLGLTQLYPKRILSDGGGEFIVELSCRPQSDFTNEDRIKALARACKEQAEAHIRIEC